MQGEPVPNAAHWLVRRLVRLTLDLLMHDAGCTCGAFHFCVMLEHWCCSQHVEQNAGRPKSIEIVEANFSLVTVEL